MYDSLITQSLVANNQMYNTELKTRLDVMLSQERVLDKAPDKYMPVCKGMEFEPFGVYAVFRRIYNDYAAHRTGDEYTLSIDGESVKCDRKTYILLRTLMDVGVSKSMARALACRELFCDIVNRRTLAGVDIDVTAKALSFGDDYYKNEVIRASLDCLFTEREQVEVSLKGMLGDEYYPGVYEALGSPNDVDELDNAIKKAYKTVCLNQEFKVKKNLGRAVNVVRYLKAGLVL